MIIFFTQDRSFCSNLRLLTHINKKLYKKFAPILKILPLLKHCVYGLCPCFTNKEREQAKQIKVKFCSLNFVHLHLRKELP